MCCHGCLAVAQAIIAAGHENFYRVRTEIAPTGSELVPEFIRESEIYDAPEIQKQYVHRLDGDSREASLILEGITCAACIWLIEQYIAALPGVEQVRVNYATQSALVRWDDRASSSAKFCRRSGKSVTARCPTIRSNSRNSSPAASPAATSSRRGRPVRHAGDDAVDQPVCRRLVGHGAILPAVFSLAQPGLTLPVMLYAADSVFPFGLA